MARNSLDGVATVEQMSRIRTFWAEFIGPEATRTNTVLALGLGAAGAVLAPARAARRSGQRAPWRAAAWSLLALDLWGGAYANNTRACARWYERPGQTDADHYRFAALHLHPFLVAAMDERPPGAQAWWVEGTALYGYLMGASWLARRARGSARRPVGLALTVSGVVLARALGSSRTAAWFAPVYFTKLLAGHSSAVLVSDGDLT